PQPICICIPIAHKIAYRPKHRSVFPPPPQKKRIAAMISAITPKIGLANIALPAIRIAFGCWLISHILYAENTALSYSVERLVAQSINIKNPRRLDGDIKAFGNKNGFNTRYVAE
ncbi:hypothetical protein, partial [Chelonobacter oris]|uniref:hypothetical protein n=1 Tax=Chelonobacter oris TaxID=505317 RepID=UPI00244D52A0